MKTFIVFFSTLILFSGLLNAEVPGIAPKAKPVDTRYKMVIDLSTQGLTLYEGEKIKKVYPVSTGRLSTAAGEYVTEGGVWTISQKEEVHKIENGPHKGGKMPLAMRLSRTGRFVHAGLLPGYPASDGCIRMMPEDAKELFGLIPIGTEVTVIGDIKDYFEKNFNPYRFLNFTEKDGKIEVLGFKKADDGCFLFEDELIAIMERKNRKLARFAPLLSNGTRSKDPKDWYLYFPNIMKPTAGIPWAELEALCKRRNLTL